MPVDAKIRKVEYNIPVEEGVKNWFHVWIENTGTASGDLEWRITVSQVGQSPYWSMPWTQVFITRMLTGHYISPAFIPQFEDTDQAVIVGVRDFDTKQVYDVYSVEIYVTPRPEPVIEIPAPVDIPKADLPWYLKWAEPVIDGWNDNIGPFFSDAATGIKKGIDSIGQSTADSLKGVSDKLDFLGDFFKDPFRAIVNSILGSKELLIKETEVEIVRESLKEEMFRTEEMKNAVLKLRESMTGTPASLTDFVESIFIEPFGALHEAMMEFLLPDPPVSFEDARDAQKKLFALVADFLILTSVLDFILTTVSATIIRHIVEYCKNIIVAINFGDLINLVLQPAFKHAVQTPLDFGYARKFKPNIPETAELINQVVKEVLNLDQFKDYMTLKGFDEEWSQRIWDAHFIAPTLQQLLYSWRKGTIDDEELYNLQILVDLDKRYDHIWEDQRYIIPTQRQIRFAYELDAITEDDVKYQLQRLGYSPADIEWLTQYLTRFTERGYKTKKLTALATARMHNAITAEELEERVLEVYPNQPAIAGIIEDIAEIRRITEEARRKEPTLRGPTLPSIEKTYVNEEIDEIEVRSLLEETYTDEAINYFIQIWDKKKTERELGKPQYFLSIAQILTAMKKLALTEEGRAYTGPFEGEEYESILNGEVNKARELLAERELSTEEIETLITSKLR